MEFKVCAFLLEDRQLVPHIYGFQLGLRLVLAQANADDFALPDPDEDQAAIMCHTSGHDRKADWRSCERRLLSERCAGNMQVLNVPRSRI